MHPKRAATEHVERRDVAIVQSTLKSVCTSDSVLVVARVGWSRGAVSEGAGYRIVVGLEVARESEGESERRRRRCETVSETAMEMEENRWILGLGGYF